MKNVVKYYKDFFGYFNALKTHCDLIATVTNSIGLTPICKKDWKLLNRISPKM